MQDQEKLELELSQQYFRVNKVLENVFQIFNLLQPIIDRLNEIRDHVLFENRENLNEIALLFIEISKLCKEIEDNKTMVDESNLTPAYFT